MFASIPKDIPGIDEGITGCIDDGSAGRTVEIAQAHGVTHFVGHTRNQGLGRSFQDGVSYALELGANVIVNTDGDNKYPQERIADLGQPIIARTAEIVIADREVKCVQQFTSMKDTLRKFGSRVVNGWLEQISPPLQAGSGPTPARV